MTKTAAPSIQAVLDEGIAAEVTDAFRLMKIGTMLTPLKRTFTGLTSASSFDLTAIDGTGETTGASNPKRLAALLVGPLRVTGGAAAAGVRTVGDVDATAAATVATISNDGKTLTFEAGVTDFVVEYIPRAAVDMTSIPAGSGMGFSP